MSTNCPPVSNMPSMSRRFRPLSMTWVRPSERGLPGRCGRSRNPSLKAGIELLQLLLGGGLHVVVERVAGVEDADLRAVADADDVALNDDLVAGAELEDLALVGDREGDLVLRHVSLGLVRGLTPNGAECDDSVTPHDRTPLLRRPRCGPRRG